MWRAQNQTKIKLRVHVKNVVTRDESKRTQGVEELCNCKDCKASEH